MKSVTIACILIWYYSMPFLSHRILCLGGIHQTGKNIWTELRSVMSPKYQIRIQLLQWREWNRRSGTENSSIGNILVLMFQKYFMDITPKEDRFPFGTQSPTRMCPPCCLSLNLIAYLDNREVCMKKKKTMKIYFNDDFRKACIRMWSGWFLIFNPDPLQRHSILLYWQTSLIIWRLIRRF